MAKIFRSLVALGIAVLALIYFLDLRRQATPTPEAARAGDPSLVSEMPGDPASVAPPAAAPRLSHSPTPAALPGAANAVSAGERVVESIPSLRTYRAEVEADPHSPPPSLQAFARELAARMEVALKSEAAAKALLPELGACARDAEIEAPKSVCVINARRLARQYPSLRGGVAELERMLPSEVMKRVEQLDAF